MKTCAEVFMVAFFGLILAPLLHGRSNHAHLQGLPLTTLPRQGGSVIPRLIHQSWKNSTLPTPSHEAWHHSWLEQNPSWTRVLWTDEQNRALVQSHFPWLLAVYDSMEGVYRADLVRA